MKIELEEYNSEWSKKFIQIEQELRLILCKLNPVIEHIGSTSVPNLAAKPLIDIAIGVTDLKDLDKTVEPMLKNKYIYYQVYNAVMPYRRFFVGLKSKKDIAKFNNIYKESATIPHEKIQSYKLCHIHVWQFDSAEWIRHIAFRDYLIEHPNIKKKYATLKKELSLKNWIDGNEYNDGKNDFIKIEETKAVLWYNRKQRINKIESS